MNDCKKSRLLFDDVFFGELTHQDKTFLDQHLENCPKCRTELNQNTSMLSGIAKKKVDEPPSDFWDNYTANLHQRMVSEGHLTGNQLLKKQTHKKGHLQQIADRIAARSVPTWTLQSAAAVVILIVGIFIGRQYFAPGPQPNPVPGPTNQNNVLLTANLTPQQKTLQRTGKFIDRSRVILLAIENFNPDTQSVQAINLPYQREVSKDLVKMAAALKQDLSETRQRRLQELIGELEIILLQIANMDPGTEMETLQLVKDGQYVRGMLYKIRINDIRINDIRINDLRRSTNKINKIKI